MSQTERPSSKAGAEFTSLLEFIKRSRGFDFSSYKQPTLVRRISKRLQSLGLSQYGDYQDYLEVHPEEFGRLFNTVLINVTSFFRDGPAWRFLEEEVIPRILAAKAESSPVRVWCAGVASGQEAYSVAILLAERLGDEQYRERVKIYATDLDEEALAQARLATYPEAAVAGLSPGRRERFFEVAEGHYGFRKEYRRAVIFGRHDLVHDAPISRIDLLLCRNTLMYFNAEAQTRILYYLHFALNDNGFLFLGKSEMPLTHSTLFVPVELKHRVFRRVPRGGEVRERPALPSGENGEASAPMLNHNHLREVAFDLAPLAMLVLDSRGMLTAVDQQARAAFGLTSQDLGRPIQDLEISYRPVDLRSVIERAHTERRVVTLHDVERRVSSEAIAFYRVLVVPMLAPNGHPMGTSIAFLDTTAEHGLKEEVQRTRRELEAAYEDLQSSNEELETTNEELQSTNEELETTNEELQSSNEELETMNEELQSTNEELETTNDELRLRTDELNRVNDFLGSILTSMRAGVVVLDRDLKVQVWNRQSEDLWGLRTDEVVGRNFLNLDIGLPVDQLLSCLRGALAGETQHSELRLTARNRRGKSIDVSVSCTPLRAGVAAEPRGAILLVAEHHPGGLNEEPPPDGNATEPVSKEGRA
jgi:two-component system CheB/CheR fusion protein